VAYSCPSQKYPDYPGVVGPLGTRGYYLHPYMFIPLMMFTVGMYYRRIYPFAPNDILADEEKRIQSKFYQQDAMSMKSGGIDQDQAELTGRNLKENVKQTLLSFFRSGDVRRYNLDVRVTEMINTSQVLVSNSRHVWVNQYIEKTTSELIREKILLVFVMMCANLQRS
jgi:hypothetical protein